jgi:cytochrome bd-type quinol oxidase subunit 2
MIFIVLLFFLVGMLVQIGFTYEEEKQKEEPHIWWILLMESLFWPILIPLLLGNLFYKIYNKIK